MKRIWIQLIMIEPIKTFLKLESAGGIMLVIATVLALIFANTPLQALYNGLLDIPVQIRFAEFEIAKPLLLWVNDGLMAVFFFLVGLELKRELVDGELSSPSKIILPGIGAIGGMAIPALIYSWFNWNNSAAMQGWAIPAATDIAFALGVLTLLGKRVPTALKIFLVSLAIIDDIGAIIIIALFYTSDLSVTSLVIAAICLVILWVLNRRNVTSMTPYIIFGLILWASVLKSGVHATLAGVALAFFIPYKNRQGGSPVKELEHDLHGTVAFFILPLFAFMNAGVVMNSEAMVDIFTAIPLGIALGLFVGKQVGIFGLCWLAVKIKLAPPPSISWSQLYGVSILCGIGFTMSLFVGSLAFEQTGENYLAVDRLGILMGSFASAIVGYLFLYLTLPKEDADE
ncbi:MAG: Na+/H+ antiporter NhaA [Oceanicoccus sp.]|uniref:Na+/H+ antiporter NhaA n=1 Tax=Oceanicoccus sp. TaxID=2691044 RepID=UPI00262F0DCD|nr:Na+/H+ antiporter NhaA [Oceanicoccus sp.]MCP3908944.1 Na+/H+ antiporter NhaA [Oceanicoccus sp.]MDG1772254.1 Na+/H+ antiporter NhaA [Oceanicoccus sp.]